MLYIVRVVVNFYIRAGFVKAFYKHSLFVEVGKTYRSYNLVHSKLFRPFVKFGKQRFCYFKIVYYVEAGKSQLFKSRLVVGTAVPNARNSSRNLAVFVSQKHFAVGKPESIVYFGVEFAELVRVKVGYGVRVVFI